MKILIVGENNKGGGAYQQSLKYLKILTEIKEFKFNFLNTTNNTDDKNFINYKLNFLDKLFFMFYSSNSIKLLLKKFKIKNRFEKFVHKNKFDLILFFGNLRLSLFCEKINYVTYIYEFHHFFRPDLPEYKGWTDYDFRENLLINNIKKSLALIVDTEKKASDLIKYYNCNNSKINIIPLSPNIITTKIDKISDENNFDFTKKFFFYPAQYWSLKNHYYILLAIKILNEKFNQSVNFIFTGSKNKNFKYLNKKVNDFGLSKQISFLKYLKDEEISFLYKNCEALVMPSLVGYSSLPLYEAFYYEKPIFYTKNLLDKSLQKFVNEIDVENPEDLANQIYNFNKNRDIMNDKIKLAKKFFNENLIDEKIQNKYFGLFNKLKYLTDIYE